MIVSTPQYAAHLDPVWDALPERGERTHRTLDAVLVAGYQDLLKARALGYRRIAYLEHGIGQSYGNGHPAYPGGKNRDAVGLFLSPNETAAGMDSRAYPNARVEVVGDPVLDTLPRGSGGSVVCTSFHWGSSLAPEMQSTMVYYHPALPELAKRFEVIGHAHPRIARKAERMYARLGIPFVADFREVCERAALYVCDNSSTLYEFASTGRPVVVLNGPAMRRNVELGLRFWTAAGVGLNVGSPADLVSGVASALADGMGAKRDRERALLIAYAYRYGAGSRAAAAITDWLADVAVAA